MRVVVCCAAIVAQIAGGSHLAAGQEGKRTLVTVWAHADDEGPVAPLLARYAREGVQVYSIIVTDGAQGAANTSVPRGPEIARLRAEEARCSAHALGINPPILLGFPDGDLGAYNADPSLLFRVAQRMQVEITRLRPDVLITWGPDGGYGHPDHRIVSSIVTELVRAGVPGIPERLFYAFLPPEGIRAMNPTRPVPSLAVPRSDLFTARVPFTDADLAAGRRSLECQKTQVSTEAVDRVVGAMQDAWKGRVPLSTMSVQASTTDLFR